MTSGDTTPALIARTTRLDSEIDLITVAGNKGVLFEQAGAGLAGRGIAQRIKLPVGQGRLEACADLTQQALSNIETYDEVTLMGCGPLAFTALPFENDSPAEVTIPSLIVGKADDGTRWITTIQPRNETPVNGEDQLRLLPAGSLVTGSENEPTRFDIRAGQSPESWCDSVTQAVKEISTGRLNKVVLTREILVETDIALPITEILQRLRVAYPSSMLYAVDGFIGASPELLVSRSGDVVRSHPMAGTAPRRGDPAVDARQAASLLSSSKDRDEHQITIDMVLDAILPFCSYVDSEPEPSIVSVANVHHLASLVEGRLSTPAASVLNLVAALHPTPAVCGWPRAEALELIHELEPFDRGRYTGPVGWMDTSGNGRFAVAIRCAEVSGNRARLFAGNGLVESSNPVTELAETRAKLQALLAAIIRP